MNISNLLSKFILILGSAILFFVSSCSRKPDGDEWLQLFNGKDIDDWIVKIYHHETGVNAHNTFRVEDGMIKVNYDKYGDFNDQFGHLYYKTPYSHFHLSLEYKFTGKLQKGAPDFTELNSGVMFHSQDPRSMPKEQNWPISVEMQFLAGLPDGKPRPTGNMCSPGTEIFYQGSMYPEHCLNSTSKTYPKDQWIHAELIVLGDSLITHIIEGDTVLQYTKPTMGGGVVDGYTKAVWEPGKTLKSGYIALQSEGQPINFRNIKLKVLEAINEQP